MKQCFTMCFLNYDIVLPKSSVVFEKGLGKVEVKCLVSGSYFGETLFGIVDLDFKTIIPLFPLKNLEKISIIDSCHIIMKVKTPFSTLYHVENRDDKIFFHFLPYEDYRYVNQDLIKVKINEKLYSLYNFRLKSLTIPFVHYVSNFYEGENRALITYFLPYAEDHYNQILAYVDTKGKIVTPYYDCDQKKEYDSSLSFVDVLTMVKEDMKGRNK